MLSYLYRYYSITTEQKNYLKKLHDSLYIINHNVLSENEIKELKKTLHLYFKKLSDLKVSCELINVVIQLAKQKNNAINYMLNALCK